ncbi:MAG: hypothetical protein PWQ55_282 [Chloroflexota bacterium]|nr:hypothetical protein [Chloroflexota bacterium]
MEKVSEEVKQESIKALRSTIRKSETALSHMAQKGANTTLVTKRLNALQIGLAVLEHIWNHNPLPYPAEHFPEASQVLAGLLPSIETIHAKTMAGSPQRTLTDRRLKALQLAIEALDELSSHPPQ